MWLHFWLYSYPLFLVIVPCCEPPPDLGAEIPGNHRWSPAGPAEGRDHRSGKAGKAPEMFLFIPFILFQTIPAYTP